MSIVRVIAFLILFLFASLSFATEVEYEIHPDWYMLACSEFSYHLKFNNDDDTFSLKFGSECENVIRPVYKGKFKVDKQSVILDFGGIKAHYYLKLPYSELCGGDTLTKEEEHFICDDSLLIRGSEIFPGGNDKNVYLTIPALFLLKIESNTEDSSSKQLINDLKRHCFLSIKEE